MNLAELKEEIWKRCRRNIINVQVAADKAGVLLPLSSIDDAEKLLKNINKKKARKIVTIPEDIITRYNSAHEKWFKVEFPNCFKDGHYLIPIFPDTGTSNGLTQAIVNYLSWDGHFANRTGNEGRVIMKDSKAIRIPSSSKKGMQDIDANIKHESHKYGIPWKIEIKINKDTHKVHQKKFGEVVKSTGAVYSVVRSIEDFFAQLDNLLILESKQTTLL